MLTTVVIQAPGVMTRHPWLAAAVLFAALWILVRLALASIDRPSDSEMPALRLSVVIPVYNEDPRLFAQVLAALAAQDRSPDRVWIVDDASASDECFELARAWAGAGTTCFAVEVRRRTRNEGKRHAQAVAFRDDVDADVFVTLDSDTVLESNALGECLRPFANPDVHGVAALILGYNWRRNALTRIVGLEFVSTFLVGRAAMSKLGSASSRAAPWPRTAQECAATTSPPTSGRRSSASRCARATTGASPSSPCSEAGWCSRRRRSLGRRCPRRWASWRGNEPAGSSRSTAARSGVSPISRVGASRSG